MELKRFVGSDSKAAMDQVRARYGDDALIISTNKVGNKTEMICAVEEPAIEPPSEKNAAEGLDISEATSTVASLLNRVAADAAAENHSKQSDQDGRGVKAGLGASRVAKEFGQELNSALRKQRDPETPAANQINPEAADPAPFTPARTTVPGGEDMHAMMQTIQQDLAQLRSQLERQAAAQTPIRQARLAMASINERMAHHSDGPSEPEQQAETLLSQPFGQQRDWAGIHAFIGLPGVGKTTAIATLAQQLQDAEPETNVVVVSLQNNETQNEQRVLNLDTRNVGLAQLCQRLGIVFLEASSHEHLGRLLQRHRQDSCVFIDTAAAALTDEQGLINLIAEHEVLPHLCVGADMSVATLQGLAKRIPWLVSSVVITRFDLASDVEGLFDGLAACSARLSAINGHLVDDSDEKNKKGNLTNTLEE